MSTERFIMKRDEVAKQIPAYAKGEAEHVSSAEARTLLQAEGRQFIYVGKELLGAIRGVAADQKLKGGNALGKAIPQSIEIASDLKKLLGLLPVPWTRD